MFLPVSAVSISLLLVGVVSGTLIRHFIQIAPLAIAIGVVIRQPAWGAYAAMPLLLFWDTIMVLIWNTRQENDD